MITLPYYFDAIRYMRPPVYGILLSMLVPVAVSIYTATSGEVFVLTDLLSALMHGAVGLLIAALIVHYLLRFTNPARGSLSRSQAAIETFSPFGLGHAIPSGTYPLSSFSGLRLRRVEPRHDRTIGKPSAVYLLQLEWASAKYRPLMLLVSASPDIPQTTKDLAHELGLPLEGSVG